MRITRGLLPFAFAGLLGLTLSACAGEESPAAKIAADPKAALTASVAEIEKGNYAYTLAAPDTKGVGMVHLPSKSATAEMNITGETEMKMELRMVEPDRWMKMTADTSQFGPMPDLDAADLGPEAAAAQKMLKGLTEMFSGKSWMHLDMSKVDQKKVSGLGLGADDAGSITGAPQLVKAVATAEGDGKTITGTIDGTKITETAGLADVDAIHDMGAEASKLPYTATLDDQGRLASLEVTVPKSGETPAGKWAMTFSGYGEQKAAEKPTGPITEMPEQAYGMLGS